MGPVKVLDKSSATDTACIDDDQWYECQPEIANQSDQEHQEPHPSSKNVLRKFYEILGIPLCGFLGTLRAFWGLGFIEVAGMYLFYLRS